MNRIEKYAKAWRDLNKVYAAYAKESGVNDPKFAILYVLYQQANINLRAGMDQRELRDVLALPKQTVSASLKELESAGIVSVNFKPNNRKSKTAVFTGEGYKRAGALLKPLLTAEKNALDEMDDNTFEHMIKGYEILLKGLEAALEELKNS